ncbi:MAG TPA: methylenetetrahydrofolate reductase, partial [Prolixibacteraceae bacterium]|nr:methylenetetrahydrofolate reductase [Prolixibacteraceae bacterium]
QVPIIPGVKPINLRNQLTVLPKIFSIDIPVELATELSKCKNDDDAKLVGTEWAIQQAKDLVAHNVPSIHIYTYGVSDNTRKIVETVF